MDFLEYLLVFNRRFKLFLAVVLVIVAAAVIYGLSFTPRYNATVTMTFAIEDEQVTEDYKYSNFYAEQAALEFTRTISGWYKDPFFQAHVFDVAKVDFNQENTFFAKIFGFFSTKRIERQNIKTTFKATTDKNAKALAGGLKKVIEHRLEAYNLAAKAKYNLAYDSVWIDKQKTPWGVLIIGALFFSFVLGLFLIYIFEYFRGTVILSSDVEAEFKKEAFDIIRLGSSEDQRYFRMRMLEEHPVESVFSLASNHSTLAGLDLPLFHFPNDVAKLKDIKEPILVLVQLGDSLERDLARVSHLLEDKKWEYLVLQ